MKLQELIQEIEQVKAQIDAYGKLPEDVLKKINYKFRLDWNYYSNKMEGGTLTRDETRSVMVGNVTVEGKPFKDVAEMNGHDVVVREILNIGTGKSRLSERRIKDVHKSIIKEEDDPQKNNLIGEWKAEPNELINYKGEKINFVPPAEVKEEMHDLLNRTNADLDAFFNNKKDAKHPLFIASDFHLDYVKIHPFFDGNGRTARIFTNLILISCGYPPIVIRDEEKQGYYKTLADIQAYGGNPNIFYGLMGNMLLRSLELVKDAIEGKPIDEKDDVTKEIQLLKQQIEAIGEKENVTKRKIATVRRVIDDVYAPMIKETVQHWEDIKDYFESSKAVFKINGRDRNFGSGVNADEIIKNIKAEGLDYLGFRIELNLLKAVLPNDISESFVFQLHFENYKCTITFPGMKGTKIIYYGDQHDESTYRNLIKSQMQDLIKKFREKISSQKEN